MKKTITLFILLFIVSSVFSQKVKFKNDIATVDGKPYVKWVKQTMANEASVYGINSNEEVLFVSYQSYRDPARVTSSNPEGNVRWLELNFLTLNIKCEVSSRTHKNLVKLLYLNNVFNKDGLIIENAKKLVAKYGEKFSDNRPNGNVKIIINN